MLRKMFMAVAVMAMGLGVLGGCQRQAAQGEAEAQTPAAAPAQAATGYDLSPESNAKFLADYDKKEGVKVHPSGLRYRVIKAGTGATPMSGNDVVTVTYKGNLIDGTVFDQTPPGQTAEFQAGGLIEGWVIALQMMKEGDQWELVLPANIGYGAQGAGGVIPPNQTLVFEMTLLKVAPAP
jgi:FKBP-type peptidyl-prolyl cis-trans isomerase